MLGFHTPAYERKLQRLSQLPPLMGSPHQSRSDEVLARYQGFHARWFPVVVPGGRFQGRSPIRVPLSRQNLNGFQKKPLAHPSPDASARPPTRVGAATQVCEILGLWLVSFGKRRADPLSSERRATMASLSDGASGRSVSSPLTRSQPLSVPAQPLSGS
jgi:hypothetical protein